MNAIRRDAAASQRLAGAPSHSQPYCSVFTHPGRRGEDANRDGTEQRRSSIQVVELEVKDGWLTCDRDEPTHIELVNRAENRMP